MKTSKGSKAKAKAAPAVEKKSVKHTAKAIMEQAEQIWLAGLGAFAKAQEQSSKLYETLVKEGTALERATRKLTGVKLDEMRGIVENTVSQVRERATDTIDRLEQVFENRVSKALGTLGIPGRDEIEQLAKRVDELSRAVRALDANTRKAPAAKKAAAAPAEKAVVKPAPKAAAKAAAPKAATPKAVAPKAAKPAAPKKAAPKVKAAPAPAPAAPATPAAE
jgi:poly(hydroxyalkanoate) granule-associated protein